MRAWRPAASSELNNRQTRNAPEESWIPEYSSDTAVAPIRRSATESRHRGSALGIELAGKPGNVRGKGIGRRQQRETPRRRLRGVHAVRRYPHGECGERVRQPRQADRAASSSPAVSITRWRKASTVSPPRSAAIATLQRRGERLVVAADHRFEVAAELAVECCTRAALPCQAKRLRQQTDVRRSRTNDRHILGITLDHHFGACAHTCQERPKIARGFSFRDAEHDWVAHAHDCSVSIDVAAVAKNAGVPFSPGKIAFTRASAVNLTLGPTSHAGTYRI